MSGVDHVAIGTPLHLLRRFGIDAMEVDSRAATVTMAMSLAGMRNPLTGAPTVGALGVLVDSVGGLVGHLRRDAGEWTVTTELAYELASGGASLADDVFEDPIVVTGSPLGPKGTSALALCTLARRGVLVGTATVRSYYVRGRDVDVSEPDETLPPDPGIALAEQLAVEPRSAADGKAVLLQRSDPLVINALGIVNGGVAAAGLELVASAVANGDGGEPKHTRSIRVSFLAPLLAEGNAHYRAEPIRRTRSTGFVDAVAVNDDGQVAVSARVTAYR